MIKHKVFKKVWKKPKSFHQGNQASSRGKGEVSWFFSSCGGNLGYILELQMARVAINNFCFFSDVMTPL